MNVKTVFYIPLLTLGLTFFQSISSFAEVENTRSLEGPSLIFVIENSRQLQSTVLKSADDLQNLLRELELAILFPSSSSVELISFGNVIQSEVTSVANLADKIKQLQPQVECGTVALAALEKAVNDVKPGENVILMTQQLIPEGNLSAIKQKFSEKNVHIHSVLVSGVTCQ